MPTINEKDTGYRGIWYFNQSSGDEYVYKYSGGLGTYCAKHRPFGVYRPEVDKTFFCYGGTPLNAHLTHSEEELANDGAFSREREGFLLHMVSYFDHKTGQVPRPTILLDKNTADAHDNPVISVDDEGYVWIFSTSHGLSRPSYIHRSTEPYSVDQFENVNPTGPRTWMTAQWTGSEWSINPVTESDSNYDTGSLYLESDGTWRIIAPTESGPRPFNPGGEMAMWVSKNQGSSWGRVKQLTTDSERNHTYARSPVNAHADFYALWADGNAREASKSCIYISDKDGNVFLLPEAMTEDLEKPSPQP